MVKNDLLKDLNLAQKQAVTHKNGPLLIIAGAGTGKTMVITKRIAWLIKEELAKPEEILALTFTDKAAQEMEERVDQLVPYGFVNTQISTFHSFGDQLIRDNHLELGFSADFRVLSGVEQTLFVKEHLMEFNLKELRPLGNPEKFIGNLLKVISRAKDEEISFADYQKYTDSLKEPQDDAEKIDFARQKEIAKFYATYQKLLQENNYLDFGDQIILLLNLFRKRKDILKQYQEQFKYILVDEYQDTNYAQNELVKLLASGHKNITVVGDDDQSIYKFRGAAISNILQFEKSFPKTEKVVLTENYRSGQNILDHAYELIQFNNPDRLEIQNKIDKKLKAQIKEKGEVKYLHFDKDYEEADFVAEEITKLIKKDKKLAYKDIAILARANNHLDQFILSLKHLNIPYVFSGEKSYYQRPEILLLTSFLKVLTDPTDSLALFHLATSEVYDLPQLDLVLCNQYAKRKNLDLFATFRAIDSLGSKIDVCDTAKGIIETIVEDIERYLEETKISTVGQVLYSFLEDKGYLAKLAREDSEETPQITKNIARFFDKIKSFELTSDNDKNIAEFVKYLEGLIEVGEGEAEFEPDPNVDAVNVLTVHSAKGLEFKTVFLVNLVQDRFPSRKRGEGIRLPDKLIKEILPEKDAHLEEERRLFYVGMTRAKDLLYLTSAANFQNLKKPKKTSQFITEAVGGEEKVDFEKVSLPQLRRIKNFRKIEKAKCKMSKEMLMKKKPLVLSNKQIDDYITCPKKYFYINILRIPLLRNHAIVFGSAIHNTIQDFLKDKQKGRIMPLEELTKAFESHWVNEGFLTKEHELMRKEEGIKILEQFYEQEKAKKDNPLYIEKSFKFAIDDILVRGRMDRIDKTKEGIEIADYKTSTAKDEKTARSKASSNLQLKIYALAYQNIFGELPKRVHLIFLGSNLTGTKKITEKDLEKAKEIIKQAHEGIKKADFEAHPQFGACKLCPFKKFCPDRKED